MRHLSGILIGGLGLAVLSAPAVPPSPVVYVFRGSSTAELWRVMADKVAQRLPLGPRVSFDEAQGRLAIISELRVTLVDLVTGDVISEQLITTRGPHGTQSPIHKGLVLKPAENALYYLTSTGDSLETFAWGLTRFDLASGKTTTFFTKEHGALFDIPDGVGLCGRSTGWVAVFKDGGFRTLHEKGDAPSVNDPAWVASCLHLPGVGVIRATVAGKVEVFDPDAARPGSSAVSAVNSRVSLLQAATFEGMPVIAYGEAVASAQATAAVDALVLYDPVEGKRLWRKKLPWNAREFVVSPDAASFALMPVAPTRLTYYERSTDRFTMSAVGLNPDDLRLFALVSVN